MWKGNFLTLKKVSGRGPFIPFLFNLVVDILTKMMKKVVEGGLIRGLDIDIIEGGVITLQYTDDTILFVDKDLNSASNLK
jgi:hypothetical protein